MHKNFGEDTSWKIVTWKSQKVIEGTISVILSRKVVRIRGVQGWLRIMTSGRVWLGDAELSGPTTTSLTVSYCLEMTHTYHLQVF
jgi:hypothetical protein